MPDPFSTEILRGFSAPPVTKPRIHSAMQILPSAAMYDSRGASYEAYSPSVVSLSSEAQQQNQEQMISPLNYPPWSATEMKEQEMIALGHINPYLMQQGRRQPFNYSEDADDFGNNNDGFNTPL